MGPGPGLTQTGCNPGFEFQDGEITEGLGPGSPQTPFPSLAVRLQNQVAASPGRLQINSSTAAKEYGDFNTPPERSQN